MIWYVCWWLALGALLASIIVAVWQKMKEDAAIKPIYVLVAGMFFSLLFMFFPIQQHLFQGDFAATFKAVLISATRTLGFFGGGGDFDVVFSETTGLSGWLSDAYALFCAVLTVLAPILTFGFVLSFFKGFFTLMRYLTHKRANTYVFSQINDHSVSLAESLQQEDPDAILIFADFPKDEKSLAPELLTRLQQLKDFTFRQNITALSLRKPNGKKTSFFAMNEKESESITIALQLIEKYRNRENTTLYLFSDSVESELMLNNVCKNDNNQQRLIVRRISPQGAFVNHLLHTDGNRLFTSAIPVSEDTKLISALVLGTGQLGTKMLKALAWYGQMDGYLLQIHAFDKSKDARDRFEALCPDLLNPEYNGIYLAGEAFHQIDVETCDVCTQTFRQKIKDIKNISYAFVCLGDDSLNIATAVELRVLFEQMHISPPILAVVSDSQKAAALQNAKNFKQQAYNIHFVGDAKTVYSSQVILNSALEKDALELHKRYNDGKPDGFYEFEYNYRSSMASVIHQQARIHCGIPGADKPESQRTAEDEQRIGILEHKRWNAYMRSEGYVYSQDPNKNSRNDLGRMHHYLVPYEKLSDDIQRIDVILGFS